MAGLVDYGVDSDRESNDSPTRSPSSNRKKSESNSLANDASNGEKRSNNKGFKSSKSGHSIEVHKNSSSSSKRKSSDRHHKHHKRSRSRDRDTHSRSKRRSRSRSREHKEHRHRDERKKKRRSKSRSRSRSSSPRRDRKPARRTRSQERREKKAATIARMGMDVTNVAASVAMSAETTNPPTDNNKVNQSAASTSAAVQAAAQQVLQNRVAEAQQVTGVTLPSFYNPAAVNPMKYAQQIQKRKLLWSNKEKNEPPATSTAKLWEATAFTQDQDGKMTAKFKRLMGIKHDPSEGGPSTSSAVEDQPESAADVLKKQQELFASLDQQYQVARATTHTQRGLGLGFSSNSSYPR